MKLSFADKKHIGITPTCKSKVGRMHPQFLGAYSMWSAALTQIHTEIERQTSDSGPAKHSGQTVIDCTWRVGVHLCQTHACSAIAH